MSTEKFNTTNNQKKSPNDSATISAQKIFLKNKKAEKEGECKRVIRDKHCHPKKNFTIEDDNTNDPCWDDISCKYLNWWY